MKTAFALSLVLSAMLVLIGCGDDGSEGDFEFLSADVARAESNATDAGPAATAGTQFGFDVLATMGEETANRAISPYSIQVALAMTRNGARGLTREEMDAVLQVESLEGADYDQSLNALDQLLLSRAGDYEIGDGETVTLELSTANSLWGQDGVAFEQPFLEDLARWYGAGMRLVDYDGDTEGARNSINGWVSDQTRERIPELIPAGVLSPATVLVLTNAIYLNAPWAFPFNEGDTKGAAFHLLDGSTVEVPLMHQSTRLPYARGDDFAAVELPYAGEKLAMLLIVPDQGRFEPMLTSMNAGALETIAHELASFEVTLDMPRFEFRTQVTLNDVLAELGMPTAFGAGADFSRITGEADLFISAVIHEAFISVDEEGTEAAAATAVVMDETSAGQSAELRIDRPFIFAIRDRESGGVLFLGAVTDPSQS